MNAYDFSLMMYNITLIPVIFFSVLFFILVLINLFVDKKVPTKSKSLKSLPFITVQIPTFNDPIGARCVKSCMNFDYPKNVKSRDPQ